MANTPVESVSSLTHTADIEVWWLVSLAAVSDSNFTLAWLLIMNCQIRNWDVMARNRHLQVVLAVAILAGTAASQYPLIRECPMRHRPKMGKSLYWSKERSACFFVDGWLARLGNHGQLRRKTRDSDVSLQKMVRSRKEQSRVDTYQFWNPESMFCVTYFSKLVTWVYLP
jgi:hypothetical protein